MKRGVIRLSTMLDCWKNSCQGATVVPTMAMMSRTAADDTPPLIPGTTKLRPIVPQWGWDRKNMGIWRRLMAMNTNIARSHRRKLPLAMMATRATAATGTATYSEIPA